VQRWFCAPASIKEMARPFEASDRGSRPDKQAIPKLVGTHHLHFANFLAAKVDPEEDQSRTFADMALAFSEGLAGTQEPDPQPSNGVVVTPAAVVPGLGWESSAAHPLEQTTAKRRVKAGAPAARSETR
jgi:hypothetical protein